MRFSTTTLLFVCIGGLIFNSGCVTAPPFPGGIRVYAGETLNFLQLDSFPVAGVLDDGTLVAIIGNGPGTQTAFAGETDGTGIDDHPAARTNATWSFQVDFTEVMDVCGVGIDQRDVPSGGGTEEFVCHL